MYLHKAVPTISCMLDKDAYWHVAWRARTIADHWLQPFRDKEADKILVFVFRISVRAASEIVHISLMLVRKLNERGTNALEIRTHIQVLERYLTRSSSV